MVWIYFIICAAVIFFAGTRLAKYADVVAERSGLGRVRVGMLVLAVITSMPELVTSLSSTILITEPNLAIGTLVGTCIFNLCLITIMDGMHSGKPVLSVVSQHHIRLVGLGVLLAVILGVGLYLTPHLTWLETGVIGIPCILTLIIYFTATFYVFRAEPDGNKQNVPVMQDHIKIERSLWVKFGVSAAAIIAGGIWLSFIGDEIALKTGWGTEFVGNLFLAITTSLPELTVALAAVRMKAVDLAVADVLGANTLDLMYVSINDLVYGGGSFLGAVSRGGVVTLGILVAMYLVVASAIKFPRERKQFRLLSWYSPLMIMLYIVGAYILFISG